MRLPIGDFFSLRVQPSSCSLVFVFSLNADFSLLDLWHAVFPSAAEGSCLSFASLSSSGSFFSKPSMAWTTRSDNPYENPLHLDLSEPPVLWRAPLKGFTSRVQGGWLFLSPYS